MSWSKEVLDTEKVIIGLLRLKALPGDPFYEGSMKGVIAQAGRDLGALRNGGVDEVLITNEFSLPYGKKVANVTLAAMGRVVGALGGRFRVPYGVEAIYDADATIELCIAMEAQFGRCAFTGAYIGDLGLVDRDVSRTLRRCRALGIQDLKLSYFMNSEGEAYLNDRPLEEITKTMMFNCHPEALAVVGGMAGSSPRDALLKQVRDNAPGDIPVFCETGCKRDNTEEIFRITDGAFAGTTFKRNEWFEEAIDEEQVASLMEWVREIRGSERA